MGDAFTLQNYNCFQQVFPETLEHVQAEATFLSNPLAQSGLASPVQEDCCPIVHLDYAVAPHDERASELLEYLTFVSNAIVVVCINRNLYDIFAAFLANQERGRRRPNAQLADHLETAGEDIAWFGVGRIAD